MTEKEQSVGRWQKEFFENIHTYVASGMSEEEAKKILEKFLYLSSQTPMPPVMDTFKNPESLEQVGVYTQGTEKARSFMIDFLNPIMKNFKVEGLENLTAVEKLIGQYPITLISNHLSHLDAPGIFHLLYTSGELGKKIAEQIVFIAGRLAFEPDFTRLGLYMFGTLLVCSKKDMSDNPSLSDIMTKINMRAFRQSQKLQTEGKIISIFPEGTRSRDGRLMPFVDTVYHYVANKIVLPISLEGTDRILPTAGFVFNPASGKLVIGKPVIVGDLHSKKPIPTDLEQIKFPETGDKKQFLIDNLALLVGSNLSRHKHGTYRNLYNGDKVGANHNELISIPKSPSEEVVVIGSTNMSVAIATVLSNKNINVKIFHPDKEICKVYNEERRDAEHYPIYKLPPNISFTSEPEDISKASLLIQGTNPWEFDKIYPLILKELKESSAPIVNVIKGLTKSPSGLILKDLEMVYGISSHRLAVAYGASYPDQIMERKISGLEIAAFNQDLLPRLIKLFTTGYVFARPAINPDDVIGVQLGGALKNIYALSMGLVEGYFKDVLGGNVDNTLFHLSNRFFKEMVSIGVSLGGKENTFNGLSGLTDFMLACFGSDSRDRRYGYDIVSGNKQARMSNGYHALKVIPNLFKLNLETHPIICSAYEVVINNKNINLAIQSLESRLSRV
jgi:glycerol-3-phosphate dehydrogenase/1-acyl-sn-glycerol-3-phosphate acyltransferase